MISWRIEAKFGDYPSVNLLKSPNFYHVSYLCWHEVAQHNDIEQMLKRVLVNTKLPC